MTIGREPVCDILLAERAVSRRHARVEPTPDGLKLTDLGSGNGVWMGARKVEEQVLSAGDHFQIGSTVFECVRVQQPAVAPAVADEAQEATMFMPSPDNRLLIHVRRALFPPQIWPQSRRLHPRRRHPQSSRTRMRRG